MNTAQEHTARGHHAGNGYAVCRKPDDIVREIVLGIVSTGGATVTLVHGRNVPSSGYVVAVKGHELRLRMTQDTHEDIRSYVERKRGVVAGSRITRPAYVGAWQDGADIVLDVVEILSDRAEAVAAGQTRGELAIWDLARGEEIRTDS